MPLTGDLVFVRGPNEYSECKRLPTLQQRHIRKNYSDSVPRDVPNVFKPRAFVVSAVSTPVTVSTALCSAPTGQSDGPILLACR